MPGPIVLAIDSDRRYWPFTPLGLARLTASTSAARLSTSAAASKLLLPNATWMIAALSTLNSTRPPLTSRTARSRSNVMVPALGFGIKPRRPRILPSLPTMPIESGVASATSNSSQPASTFLARSSPPTSSAPARSASCALSPCAKTATRTTLPVPWGRTTVPRTIWSAWRGSTPRRRCASIDASKLTVVVSLTSWAASSGGYARARSTSFAASRYFLPWAMSLLPFVSVGVPTSPCAGWRRREPECWLDDLDAHRAGSALDLLHRSLDVVRVEVGHLRLGDLADLVAADAADHLALRGLGALLDAGSLAEQVRSGRRLEDEAERAVLVDGDLG